MNIESMTGGFVEDAGDTWYRIDQPDLQRPFFMTLAGDSDLWAFISSAGSLTAGRRDADGAFFPYETVDKIHLRGLHTGPRTWVRLPGEHGPVLWTPFAPGPAGDPARRSLWKNLSGTSIRFREEDPSGQLAFQQDVFARLERLVQVHGGVDHHRADALGLRAQLVKQRVHIDGRLVVQRGQLRVFLLGHARKAAFKQFAVVKLAHLDADL